MKEDSMDYLFDDKKLKKTYKRAKLASTIRTIIIVILVTIPLYIIFQKINTRVTYNMETKYYDEIKRILQVTKPHAYVSKANDVIGFLGASGEYTVTKDVGARSQIELYDEKSRYWLLGAIKNNRVIMSEGRGVGHKTGEWPVNFDKGGNLSMMLFHPDINYKEYKNDLASLNKVSSDSLLEMTLSLDKKYKANEILDILPDVNISEILIDGYTEEEINKYKTEAKSYDGKATFIPEDYYIRFAASEYFGNVSSIDLSRQYEDFLNNLQFNYKYNAYYKQKFMNIYSTLKSKSQLDVDKVDIIGVVVYGSPQELEKLKSNLHIKASSVGIVTRDIIFK